MQNPTNIQRISIRLMILIGVGSFAYVTYRLSDPQIVLNTPMYYCLYFSFIFSYLTILYEWYHYWNIRIPENPAPLKEYTVDVFTTFCKGEPYWMIEETLRAIVQIRYPHQSYLCDEADDPYLKNLCAELGVHHITRTDKKMPKPAISIMR